MKQPWNPFNPATGFLGGIVAGEMIIILLLIISKLL